VRPIDVPGQDVALPPHEQFLAQVEADWTLYDGGRTRRQEAAERARLDEEVAGVTITLYALREATTEAFFGALLATARERTLALVTEDLAARLRVLQRQAAEGAALATDAAVLEAELLRLHQQSGEAAAIRRAALDVLAELTGVPEDTTAVLALPALDAETTRAIALLDAGTPGPAGDAEASGRGRPELARLARAAERAEAEALARETQLRPTVSLFGQAGVGRPSPLDFFTDDIAEYGLLGVRLRWPLFDGGRVRHDADALRIQARLAQTEADAFTRRIARDVEDERADLARLDAALTTDQRIVALREEILRVARSQLDEGVMLPDTYTDRLTDLAEARLALERHRIERAQAQARLLSTLGRFPEPPGSTLTIDIE
jgi:outer membrane protein TolC